MRWSAATRVAAVFFAVMVLLSLAALKLDFAAVAVVALLLVGAGYLWLRRPASRRPAVAAVAWIVAGALAVGIVAAAVPAQHTFTKRLLLGLLRSTAAAGALFTAEETVGVSGGDVPQGQTAALNVQARGRLLGDGADMSYDITTGNKGSYQVILTPGDFYLRQRNAADWVVTSRGATTFLLVGLALTQLERELEATSPSGPVIPWAVGENVAGDNVLLLGDHVLEYRLSSGLVGELENVLTPVDASGRLFLIVSPLGDRLDGITMHLLADDPDAQQRVRLDAMTVFKPGRGGGISPPGDAKRVDVGDIFG